MRSLFNYSSGSCHDSDVMWQEISRTCGSTCSSPRPVQRLPSFFSTMYCLFDPSSTFVGFSVQNSGGRPIDHVVVMICMVIQCWFVLLRQTWCMLVSGKRFASYGFHLCLVFLQSITKFPSSLSYVTFLTVCTWNFVYAICNFLLLLFILWMHHSEFYWSKR